MTGAARVSALHLRHVETFCILTGCKDSIVTVVTLIKTRMEFVTEGNRSGLLDFILDLFCSLVTAVTISLYRKSKYAVMAGTTGEILLHLGHRIAPVFTVRLKESVMAVTAAIKFNMPCMRKACIGGEDYLPYRVALAALLGNRKGGFAVMTRTT